MGQNSEKLKTGLTYLLNGTQLGLDGESWDIAGLDDITLTKEIDHSITVTATSTAATAGGAITITAGTSGTSGTGGALTLIGGVGGTTGTGGAISLTSGAGGTTSGVSGAITVASGAPTALSGSASGALSFSSAAGATKLTTTAGASGALTFSSGAGGATTGTATGGASGAVTISTGTGGSGNATGTGGAAGTLSITGGNGGAAMGAGTGGAGALVVVTPGTGGTTSGGTAGLDGFIALRGNVGRKMTVTAMTDTATISVAGIRGGMIVGTPTAAANYTTPTGAVLADAFPAGSLVAGDTFELNIVNVATNDAYDITLVAGASGITFKFSNVTVEANSATTKQTWGRFLFVCTSATADAETFDVYRIA